LAKLGEKVAGGTGKSRRSDRGQAAKPAAEKAIAFLSGLLSGDTKDATKNISKDDFTEYASA
jgi:hypothetical protein